jgi:hypothetical protein
MYPGRSVVVPMNSESPRENRILSSWRIGGALLPLVIAHLPFFYGYAGEEEWLSTNLTDFLCDLRVTAFQLVVIFLWACFQVKANSQRRAFACGILVGFGLLILLSLYIVFSIMSELSHGDWD